MAGRKRILSVLAPLVVAGALVFGAWAWLNLYTRHKARVDVPELKGLSFQEAKAQLAERDLLVEVVDSVYNDDAPKSTVVDQNPPAGHQVKPDRTIYLVMNASQPKMLNMPALVNLSKRQALSVLEILGIKVRELQYRPDPCVDCVVAQLYQGQVIQPEERIRRGEAVTLVLGSGQNGARVQVPDVRGLVLTELGEVLNMSSLNLGVVVECVDCNTAADTALARVVRQSPDPYAGNMMGMGGMIDVWLTMDTTGLVPHIDRNELLKKDTNDVE